VLRLAVKVAQVPNTTSTPWRTVQCPKAAPDDPVPVAPSALIGAALGSLPELADRECYRDQVLSMRRRLRSAVRQIGAFEPTTPGPSVGSGDPASGLVRATSPQLRWLTLPEPKRTSDPVRVERLVHVWYA